MLPHVDGKDLTFAMTGEIDPSRRRRQRQAVATESHAGQSYNLDQGYGYDQPVSPLRNGQWRTQFKRVGQPMKTTYSLDRPEIQSANGVVHIHTERFDVIVRFSDVELLECEFGEMPEVIPEPFIDEEVVLDIEPEQDNVE